MVNITKMAVIAVVAAVALAGVATASISLMEKSETEGINLVIGTDCVGLSVSPSSTYFSYWTCAISQMCLVDWDEGIVKPCLAKSWEYNDRFTEYTFKLREDVYWSDGVKFTANDVKNTMDYVLSKGSTKYSKIDLINDYEVKITTYDDPKTAQSPDGNANLLTELGSNFNIAYPAHVFKVEDMPYGNWATYTGMDRYIGTGPMYFTGYDSKSGEYTFSPNKYYYGGTPSVSKLTIKSYANNDALMMALLMGEVDTVYNYGAMGMNMSYLSQVLSNDKLYIKTIETRALGPSLWFNQDTELGAVKDIRLAVRYAINYDEVMEYLCPGLSEHPNTGVWSPRGSFFTETPKCEYDTEKAIQILNTLGYSKKGSDKYLTDSANNTLKLNIVTSNNIVSCIKAGELVKEYLEEIGIETTVTVPSVSISKAIKEDRYEIAINTWTAGATDSNIGFLTAPLQMSQMMGQNINDDATVKELVNELRNTAVPDREGIANKIQKYWSENAPIVCMYWYSILQPYNSAYVGFTNHSTWGILSVGTMMNLSRA